MNGERHAWSQPLKQALILFAAGAACWALIMFSPLHQFLHRSEDIRQMIRGFGWGGPIVFVAAVALFVAIGVPRLALCTLAGFVFGFAEGLSLVLAGTLVGYYATFLVVRRGGTDLSLDRWGRARRLSHLIRRNGFVSVCLMRFLPINGFTTNIALGLSPVSHVDFLAGSALGLIPEAIPFTLIGTGVTQNASSGLVYAFVAALLLLGVGVLQHLYGSGRDEQAEQALNRKFS